MKKGFKVGDKVIAKKDKLDSAKGKIGVITQIVPDTDLCVVKYENKISHNCGLVSDEWPFRIGNIESANPSIHIYPNKANTNETIAILKQGKEVIKEAKAIKAVKTNYNSTDEYDFNKGAEIAFSRLLEVKEATQKPMEVREVKRKAKVGEWVKIIDASNIPKTNGINDYNNGSIIQVIGIENDSWKRARYGYGVADNCTNRVLTDSEYVVLENYNQLDLSTITNEQLIAELTNRLGGK